MVCTLNTELPALAHIAVENEESVKMIEIAHDPKGLPPAELKNLYHLPQASADISAGITTCPSSSFSKLQK